MRIAGLILAGGRAQRMGGIDKGLQIFHGQALVAHVCTRLAQQVEQIWICSHPQAAKAYRTFGYPLLHDDARWFQQGPLAGIASFAHFIPQGFTHIQLAPCDTPFLPLDLCLRLQNQVQDVEYDSAYPCTNTSAQYACALVNKAHLESVQNNIEKGQRSLHGWLNSISAQAVGGFMENNFINLNTIESLIHHQSL